MFTTMRTPNILSVYDVNRYYRDFNAKLQLLGKVTLANSAQEALELITEKGFDLIVTDIMLPPGLNHCDGQLSDIVRRFLGDKRMYAEVALYFIAKTKAEVSLNQRTPIIVATEFVSESQNVMPDAMKKAVDAGARNYFSMNNPEYFDDLVNAAKSALGIKR